MQINEKMVEELNKAGHLRLFGEETPEDYAEEVQKNATYVFEGQTVVKQVLSNSNDGGHATQDEGHAGMYLKDSQRPESTAKLSGG